MLLDPEAALWAKRLDLVLDALPAPHAGEARARLVRSAEGPLRPESEQAVATWSDLGALCFKSYRGSRPERSERDALQTARARWDGLITGTPDSARVDYLAPRLIHTLLTQGRLSIAKIVDALEPCWTDAWEGSTDGAWMLWTGAWHVEDPRVLVRVACEAIAPALSEVPAAEPRPALALACFREWAEGQQGDRDAAQAAEAAREAARELSSTPHASKVALAVGRLGALLHTRSDWQQAGMALLDAAVARGERCEEQLAASADIVRMKLPRPSLDKSPQ